MQWENLTEPDFAKAVKSTGGVCILAVGCLERHFEHLPLGTDMLNGHAIACLAAEREPAVVFPPYYFGQIHEAKHYPGAIALDPVLTLQVLMATCDEIGRNGFRKIIILNAHGGNRYVLGYLVQSVLAQRKPYTLYLFAGPGSEWRKKWKELLETDVHGHACECETSVTLANFPELVKMDALRGRKGPALGRAAHVAGGYFSNQWYTDSPEHYMGDANPATAGKGKKLVAIEVAALAEYVRAVRKDKAVNKLRKEFYDRCDRVGK